MKISRPVLILVPFSAVLASACYRNPDNTPSQVTPLPTTPSLQDRLQNLNTDLKVGDVGPNVKAVHDYLATYGYYPNADLAAQFPAWRPTIANDPQDANVFDQQTADAVRQLQINYGLAPTGIVDQPTRTAMLSGRCGVPDGIPRLDPSDKFALGTIHGWNTQAPIQIFVQQAPFGSGLNSDQVSSAISQAGATWGAATNLLFSVTSPVSLPDGGVSGSGGSGGAGGTNPSLIYIQYAALDGVGGQLAHTAQSGFIVFITLDIAEMWSTSTPTPSNAIDLQSVVLHELGHALGLDHSGVLGLSETTGAVMYPLLAKGAEVRALTQDDRLAVRPIFDSYVQMPGAAKDIGAGTDGSVWVIGTIAEPGGFSIHKWNGTGWDFDSNGASAAVRISVSPDGSPWVVNSGGFVYHKSSNSALTGTWQLIPGLFASDIAASGTTAWALSTTPAPGGFQIFFFDGRQWNLDSNGTIGATRIAVDNNNAGLPWIVQSSGAVLFRYEGWTTMSGLSAVDIAVPPSALGANAWAVQSNGAQLLLNLFDMQSAVSGPPGLNAPSVMVWWSTSFLSTPGATAAVAAAGPTGQPWIVDGAGNIFRSRIP